MADEGIDIDKLLRQVEYQDLYSLLSVPRDASTEEIKRQYRKLIRTFHPDKQADDNKKALANEMFAALTQAVEILSDPQRRKVYDEYGIQGIISGWELAKHSGQANVWEEVLKQAKKKQEEALGAANTTTLETFIDVSTLYEKYWLKKQDPYQGVELTCVAINHTVEVPVTEESTVTLSAGTAASVNGLYPDGRAASHGQLVYQYAFSRTTVGALQLATNTRNHTVAGTLVKTLNAYNTGIGRATYDINGMGLSLSLDTKISKAWSTLLTVAANSYNNSITLKTTRNISDSSNISVSCTMGDAASYADIDAWKAVTDSVSVNVGVTSGGRCKVGASNQVTESTRVGFDVGIDLSGAIGLDIKLSYFKHKLKIPVIIANELSGVAALTAVCFPIAFYSLFRLMVVNPLASIAAAKELKKQKERQAIIIAQNKKRAERDVSLMKETVDRKIYQEQRVRGGGLIIVSAIYGNLRAKKSGSRKLSDSVISVTTQLQFQVEDSKLELVNDESKSTLLGFYDPCIGEQKWLKVVYRFKDKLHEVTVADTEPLRIPRRSHIRE